MTDTATFTAGQAVTFQTSGRGGVSPARKGTVLGTYTGTRGVWIEVREDGAAEGVTVKARGKLVQAA